MQILDKLIYEQLNKITKPIAESITKKVLNFLGISKRIENNIYYHDIIETAKTTTDNKHRPKVNQNRCDVTITPINDPKNLIWLAHTFEHTVAYGLSKSSRYSIFEDRKDMIILDELNIPSGIDLSFSIKFRSIEASEILNSALFLKFMNSGIVKYHDISYNYPLPAILLLSLYSLYELKDNPNYTFKEYIDFGSNNQIGLVSDRNNLKQTQFNILKNTLYVLGSGTFSHNTEKISKNKYPDRYEVKFDYHVEFEKPYSLRLSYPIVISNKFIPEKLVISNKHNDELLQTYYDEYYHPFKIYNNFYNNATDIKVNIYKKYKPIIIPDFDNWKITPIMNNKLYVDYLVIFQAVIMVNTDDVGAYIELSIENDILPNIESPSMKLFVKDMIEFQYKYNNRTEGILNVSIFRNDNLVDPSKYNLNNSYIKIRDGIDKDAIYRVTLNLAINYNKINRESIIKGFNYDYNDLIIIKHLSYLEAENLLEITEIVDNYYVEKQGIIQDLTPGYTTKMKGKEYGTHGAFRVGRFIFKTRCINN